MIKNIILLVGGKGTRLGELTKKTPKPLLQFNGRPFLDYILFKLLDLRPKKIILLCCYKSNLFFKRYHNRHINKVLIKCIKEYKLLGTGGSLQNAKRYIIDNTLVMNGDTYFQYNFKKLNTKLKKKNIIKIFCIKNTNYKSNKKLSSINVNQDAVEIKKKSNYMNSGIYLINKNIKKFLKKNKFSLENDLLEELIKDKRVCGEKLNCFSLDIGTKKNFRKFKKISNKLNIDLFY